jgi:hypothetical protein
VQNEIYRQMEENENRKYDRVGRNLAGAGGGAPGRGGGAIGGGDLSIPDQIEKLDQLRQKGIICNEEFQAKKVELLDRM